MVYLKNRSLTKLLNRITFYKSDTSSKSDLENLHRFNYIAYQYNKDAKCTKLINQDIKYVFLSYKGHN